MQLSFVTQAVRNAGSAAAAGASTAVQWGSRTVSTMGGYLSNLPTYATNAAACASKFFASCMTKATAFCVAQPYVAATIGILGVAIIAFLAGRRFGHP